jgi:rhodanese-related sulfurtransferase
VSKGGVIGVLPGIIGMIQAMEAIKLIIGIGDTLVGRLVLFDALGMTFEEVKLDKNPKCVICSGHPTLDHLIDYEQFCGVPGHDRGDESSTSSEWNITPRELKARLDAGEPIRVVDVREPQEWELRHILGAELIALDTFLARMHELDSAQTIVLYCHLSPRAARAVQLLANAGFRKMKNLRGGINAWMREIDPALPQY